VLTNEQLTQAALNGGEAPASARARRLTNARGAPCWTASVPRGHGGAVRGIPTPVTTWVGLDEAPARTSSPPRSGGRNDPKDELRNARGSSASPQSGQAPHNTHRQRVLHQPRGDARHRRRCVAGGGTADGGICDTSGSALAGRPHPDRTPTGSLQLPKAGEPIHLLIELDRATETLQPPSRQGLARLQRGRAYAQRRGEKSKPTIHSLCSVPYQHTAGAAVARAYGPAGPRPIPGVFRLWSAAPMATPSFAVVLHSVLADSFQLYFKCLAPAPVPLYTYPHICTLTIIVPLGFSFPS